MSGLMALVEKAKPGTYLTSRKRPAADGPDAGEPAAVDVDAIDLDGAIVDASCDQVRKKIRRYLDSGEKVGEFCDKISVTNHSLNTFLGQNWAMKGAGSKTYMQAWEFFKKHELAGVKEPTVSSKKRKSNDAASKAKEKIDLSDIRLPEEEQGRRTGTSQAQFCRDLMEQSNGRKITLGQVQNFRSLSGPTIGNTNIVFYTAYVFFEKLWIKEDMKKSKHRLEMEKIYPDGFEIDRKRDGRILAPSDAIVTQDKYGQMEWHRPAGGLMRRRKR
ncbi:hypothetical protein TI39_contig613g00006 [Zymoseptoria brevis]|uniref:DUF7726 domain-containing protein n=1 Tax=Zymoseptoria brevis TaxID=1047168 RepID=A0A0F4GHT2_9PEZI|nr:hypothetical protein TI39_contig613g00006 [Zymoseptoria brevis]